MKFLERIKNVQNETEKSRRTKRRRRINLKRSIYKNKNKNYFQSKTWEKIVRNYEMKERYKKRKRNKKRIKERLLSKLHASMFVLFQITCFTKTADWLLIRN